MALTERIRECGLVEESVSLRVVSEVSNDQDRPRGSFFLWPSDWDVEILVTMSACMPSSSLHEDNELHL